ncbi:hypothetical protein RAA17_23825 [Komagataeibacter rhaeticus]|nr:hypothetical protein [Komagataeibacter rhaeticus]
MADRQTLIGAAVLGVGAIALAVLGMTGWLPIPGRSTEAVVVFESPTNGLDIGSPSISVACRWALSSGLRCGWTRPTIIPTCRSTSCSIPPMRPAMATCHPCPRCWPTGCGRIWCCTAW